MANLSIERYAQALRAINRSCTTDVMRAIAAYAERNPNFTIEELRNVAILVGTEALDLYGGAASQAAAGVFDDAMVLEGISVAAAETAEVDYSGIRSAARYQVGKCGTLLEFAEQMGEAVSYYAREGAQRTMMQNVSRASETRSGKSVRYARVPTGVETCNFCTMLASRGFVYKSEQSAGHANHRGCNCLIVPGIQGKTKIAGYDTEQLQQRWKVFEEIDKREDLTKSEQRLMKLVYVDAESPLDVVSQRTLIGEMNDCMWSEWLEFKKNKSPENYDNTIRHLIREVGKAYGMELDGDYTRKRGYGVARPDGFELWAVTRMRGVFDSPVQFLRTSNSLSPDLLIDGVYWDIKTPKSEGKIADRLHHGFLQCTSKGQSAGMGLLSFANYAEESTAPAEDMARDFIREGKFETIYAIAINGMVSQL